MKRQLWTIAVLSVFTSILSLPVNVEAQTETSDYGIQEVSRINELIRQGWADYEIRPSVAASDGEWVRRLYLDILGRVPSVDELREFTKERSPEKRKALVTKLLYDEEYTEQYANNWTTIWTNVLIGRSGGTERNSLINRPGMQKYLRDSLARNKYYNEICLLYTSPSPRDRTRSRMPSSA